MASHAPRLQSTLLSYDGFEGNCTLSLSNTSCTIFSIFKLEVESVEFHVHGDRGWKGEHPRKCVTMLRITGSEQD